MAYYRVMSQLTRSFRQITPHKTVISQGVFHRMFGSVSTSNSSSPHVKASPFLSDESPLDAWNGADVEIIVHESFERMVPIRTMMLPGAVFNAPVRPDLVHRVVHWQLAKRRQGTSKTKNRSEVVGSGRKIRAQKGTGRSRQGDAQSPIFRGGGRVHGPVPRNYYYLLPRNVRRNALRSVLTSKLINGQLWIADSAAISDSRTKTVVDLMDSYGWNSALIADNILDGTAGVETSLRRASFVIRNTLPINVRGLNVYDALSFNHLILTTAAVEHLAYRYKKYGWVF